MIQPTSKENRDAKVLLSDRSEMLAELAKAKEMIKEANELNSLFTDQLVCANDKLIAAQALLADAATVLEEDLFPRRMEHAFSLGYLGIQFS